MRDMFDKTISEQEALSKKLREEKKTIKETHEESVGQRQQVRFVAHHSIPGVVARGVCWMLKLTLPCRLCVVCSTCT